MSEREDQANTPKEKSRRRSTSLIIAMFVLVFSATIFLKNARNEGSGILPVSSVRTDAATFEEAWSRLLASEQASPVDAVVGYSSTPVWAMYRVKRGQSIGAIFEVRNPMFQEVEVYVDGVKADLEPFYPFPAVGLRGSSRDQVVVVKFKTNTMINLDSYVMTRERFESARLIINAVYSSYVTFIAIAAIVCLYLYQASRNRVFLIYFFVVMSFHGLSVTTLFGAPYLWVPEFRKYFDFVLVVSELIAVVASSLLILEISKSEKVPRAVGYACLSAAIALIPVCFFYRGPVLAAAAFILSMLCIGWGILVTGKIRESQSSFRAYVFAWISICSGTIVFSANYAGLVEGYAMRYVFLIGAVCEVAIVIGMITRKIHRELKHYSMLNFSLAGLVSNREIMSLATGGKKLDISPDVSEISVIYLDIKGYTGLIDSQDDDLKMLKILRDYYSIVTMVVHDFGGVFNKTVGDAAIAYFGRTITGERQGDHADRAVQCALHIQRALANHLREQSLPLMTRVGVASGNSAIGDIGTGRIDYTVVGRPAITAQRMEQACSPMRVLASKSTRKRLVAAKDLNFETKLVMPKHSTELVEAYEINPFTTLERELESSMEASYRRFFGKSRAGDRVAVQGEEFFDVTSPMKIRLRILNTSLGGLGFVSSSAYADGLVLFGKFAGRSAVLEVVWSKREQSEYMHGGRFVFVEDDPTSASGDGRGNAAAPKFKAS